MQGLEVPVQAVVNNLTKQISQLSYDLAVANAALTAAKDRISEITAKDTKE